MAAPTTDSVLHVRLRGGGGDRWYPMSGWRIDANERVLIVYQGCEKPETDHRHWKMVPLDNVEFIEPQMPCERPPTGRPSFFEPEERP